MSKKKPQKQVNLSPDSYIRQRSRNAAYSRLLDKYRLGGAKTGEYNYRAKTCFGKYHILFVSG